MQRIKLFEKAQSIIILIQNRSDRLALVYQESCFAFSIWTPSDASASDFDVSILDLFIRLFLRNMWP